MDTLIDQDEVVLVLEPNISKIYNTLLQEYHLLSFVLKEYDLLSA